jgi:hypothetical protein
MTRADGILLTAVMTRYTHRSLCRATAPLAQIDRGGREPPFLFPCQQCTVSKPPVLDITPASRLRWQCYEAQLSNPSSAITAVFG